MGHLTFEIEIRSALGQSATTKTSFASAISRADGVMMVFFPMTILELASTAARPSSSQTNPTGFACLFSACACGGSSCVYEDNGGAAAGAAGAGTGLGATVLVPSHRSTISSMAARPPSAAAAAVPVLRGGDAATSRTP